MIKNFNDNSLEFSYGQVSFSVHACEALFNLFRIKHAGVWLKGASKSTKTAEFLPIFTKKVKFLPKSFNFLQFFLSFSPPPAYLIEKNSPFSGNLASGNDRGFI